MMTTSKFSIGQKVRHTLLGYLGVIIDVDAEYSLHKPQDNDISENTSLRLAPWYRVIMEDSNGAPIQIYLSEAQLTYDISDENPEQSSLVDELSKSIKLQLRAPRLRN